MANIIHSLSPGDLAAKYRETSVLVTGSNGFVAGYLIPRLNELGSAVHGLDVQQDQQFPGYEYHNCDILDRDQLVKCVAKIKPAYVFHLASLSSVGSSWRHEWQTIETNVRTTFNLFKTLDDLSMPVQLLLVSSGEVYGDLKGAIAAETDELKPLNPYSASKAMMEMVAHKFQNSKISYVIARSYNHTGPGRPPNFFEASVAKQFAEAKIAGNKTVNINVGNIDNIRDFSDVRDIVEKYLLLGCLGKPGDAYNVCSGNGTALREIITMIAEISGIDAQVNIDEGKFRRNDISFLVGRNNINFENRPLDVTLRDLFESFL